MPIPNTPGVYIEELPKLPQAIGAVETAIPVFIGYTEKAMLHQPDDLHLVPQHLLSMPDYELYFGGAPLENGITINLDITDPANATASVITTATSPYIMYQSLQLFYSNGGGACYIISIGTYNGNTIDNSAFLQGLAEAAKINEITLLLFPDAYHLIAATAYYNVVKEALAQCLLLKDRFTVFDIWKGAAVSASDAINLFNNADLGEWAALKYGAVYYPALITAAGYRIDESAIMVIATADPALQGTLSDLATKNPVYYALVKKSLADCTRLMPPSPAVAGIYNSVDQSRGVWKAPANVSINNVLGPELMIDDHEQEEITINVTSGRSINMIRSFAGRGNAIIWGARTLAGNDNEWRYVSVRRYFNMVEESVSLALQSFVFEPNDTNTWNRVKGMIENFLVNQWRAGALQGAKPEQAFFVNVGLGTTMTAVDILEGNLVVEIGIAMVRPAEYIIIHISKKLASA